MTQFLEGPIPPLLKKGGSNYVTLALAYKKQKPFINKKFIEIVNLQWLDQ